MAPLRFEIQFPDDLEGSTTTCCEVELSQTVRALKYINVFIWNEKRKKTNLAILIVIWLAHYGHFGKYKSDYLSIDLYLCMVITLLCPAVFSVANERLIDVFCYYCIFSRVSTLCPCCLWHLSMLSGAH